MKYSLRSLMIVAILGPPVLAGAHFAICWLLERPRGVDLSNGIDFVYEVDEP